MRIQRVINLSAVFVAVAVTTSATLPLMAGEDLATSAAYGSFRLNTSGRRIVISSQEDIAALADWPAAYCKGETVTWVAPDGSATTLAEDASSDGDAVFAPTTGGLWKLVNSSGETAPVGVAWDVFNDGWSLVFGAFSPFLMSTEGDGPDRRGFVNMIPPVAYSGDDWLGDPTKASAVTFISPDGTSTTLDLTGTGTETFTFNRTGHWTIQLTVDDVTQEARLFIRRSFTISFR